MYIKVKNNNYHHLIKTITYSNFHITYNIIVENVKQRHITNVNK